MGSSRWVVGAGVFALALVTLGIGLARSDPVTVPYTFTAGTPAVAAEVNANLAALGAAIDALGTRLEALEAAAPRVTFVSGTAEDGTDSGIITSRTLSFTKASATSRLRITWSDNLRVYGSGAVGSRWEVLLDGSPVASPNRLVADVYVNASSPILRHTPTTVVGMADDVAAGSHQLTISVALLGSVNPATDAYTGFPGTTWFLIVEELP